MLLTVPELGGILIVLAGVLFFLGRLPTITALFAFFGLVIIGTAGWLGRALSATAGWVSHLFNTATANIIGGGLTAALTIALIVLFVHDVHPKNQAGHRTLWFGVALAAVIVAGVSGIPSLSGVRSGIINAASGVISAL
jgi:hypothetical protein